MIIFQLGHSFSSVSEPQFAPHPFTHWSESAVHTSTLCISSAGVHSSGHKNALIMHIIICAALSLVNLCVYWGGGACALRE